MGVFEKSAREHPFVLAKKRSAKKRGWLEWNRFQNSYVKPNARRALLVSCSFILALLAAESLDLLHCIQALPSGLTLTGSRTFFAFSKQNSLLYKGFDGRPLRFLPKYLDT